MAGKKLLRRKGKWAIDLGSLLGRKPDARDAEECFLDSSPSDKRLAVIYGMTEMRMCWHVGNFAIFEKKADPTIVLHPRRILCVGFRTAVRWVNDRFLAIHHYCTESDGDLLAVPFLLIDFQKKRFACIPIENSFPYNIVIKPRGIMLREVDEDDRFRSHDGEYFPFVKLTWHPLQRLNASKATILAEVRREGRRQSRNG